MILTKGWPTLRGSRTVNPQQPWDVDAPATARLREAGAVLLGKTATPEFGCKGETNSPASTANGQGTRNPWDVSKTPWRQLGWRGRCRGRRHGPHRPGHRRRRQRAPAGGLSAATWA